MNSYLILVPGKYKIHEFWPISLKKYSIKQSNLISIAGIKDLCGKVREGNLCFILKSRHVIYISNWPYMRFFAFSLWKLHVKTGFLCNKIDQFWFVWFQIISEKCNFRTNLNPTCENTLNLCFPQVNENCRPKIWNYSKYIPRGPMY